MSAGSAAFGDDLRFPIQLLGAESRRDGTWLWAWADTESNLPRLCSTSAALLHLRGWLRDYGGRVGVAGLTEPSFPPDRADGARMALVASGPTGRSYYGGPLFFHLENVPDTPERVITVLSQVIQTWPLPLAFLTQRGWSVAGRRERRTLVGSPPDRSTIETTFDEQGRIARSGGQIQPR